MKARVFAVIVCMAAVANSALAENIRGINIDFVTIGHAGNTADTGGTAGCGAVGDNYLIGKYAVTNAQWNTFTAAAGAPTGTDGGYSYGSYWTGAKQPVNNVSWYEAAQFCNYLTSGDKSKGAYQFSGNNSNPNSFIGINRAAAISTYGTAYVIPTADEWYKAAYFKPDGSGYSLFANGTNIVPVVGVQSNYSYSNVEPWNVQGQPWNVDSGAKEQNGTYNMMGNVRQWNETLFYGSLRGHRGGSYRSNYGDLSSLASAATVPYNEGLWGGDLGFRVAAIPEPATMVLLGLGGIMIRKFKSKS
jgi:formylglycine-generating enzyme